MGTVATIATLDSDLQTLATTLQNELNDPSKYPDDDAQPLYDLLNLVLPLLQ